MAEQLEWEGHIVEYVNFVHGKTRVHGNAAKDSIPASLDKWIPLLGPRFVPPPYLYHEKRQSAPEITPVIAHLKPLNVVHPFYYPDISVCPKCRSADTYWDGWNAKGSREVHGIKEEEAALGFQLRCKNCRGDGQFCIATTNPLFWEKWEHWKIPRNKPLQHIIVVKLTVCIAGGIPQFFKRCAVTRELFDFIIELRPSETSAGLAKHIKHMFSILQA